MHVAQLEPDLLIWLWLCMDVWIMHWWKYKLVSWDGVGGGSLWVRVREECCLEKDVGLRSEGGSV